MLVGEAESTFNDLHIFISRESAGEEDKPVRLLALKLLGVIVCYTGKDKSLSFEFVEKLMKGN